LYAALRFYYRSASKVSKKKQISSANKSGKSSKHKNVAGSTASSSSNKLSRPQTVMLRMDSTSSNGTKKATRLKTERALLMQANSQEDVRNLPAEELLELGNSFTY
jgi:hypothetical protein